jgi:hypothetical protein
MEDCRLGARSKCTCLLEPRCYELAILLSGTSKVVPDASRSAPCFFSQPRSAHRWMCCQVSRALDLHCACNGSWRSHIMTELISMRVKTQEGSCSMAVVHKAGMAGIKARPQTRDPRHREPNHAARCAALGHGFPKRTPSLASYDLSAC